MCVPSENQANGLIDDIIKFVYKRTGLYVMLKDIDRCYLNSVFMTLNMVMFPLFA